VQDCVCDWDCMADSVRIYIGSKSSVKWSEDGEFEEATLTSFNALALTTKRGCHNCGRSVGMHGVGGCMGPSCAHAC
jgi:hypothetical protein